MLKDGSGKRWLWKVIPLGFYRGYSPVLPFLRTVLLELAGTAASQGCGGPETCPHPSLQDEGPSPSLTRHVLPPQWGRVSPSGTGSSHGGQLWKGPCSQQGCLGGKRGSVHHPPVPLAPAAADPSPEGNAEQAPKNVAFKLNFMRTQKGISEGRDCT